jgi:hypothetical protein
VKTLKVSYFETKSMQLILSKQTPNERIRPEVERGTKLATAHRTKEKAVITTGPSHNHRATA